MSKPELLGVEYARLAMGVKLDWERQAREGRARERKLALAKLKSLRVLEHRVRQNPLAAGDPVRREHWPRSLARDYGTDIPNLFRFELAERWRGYYSLVGEPGGARVWVLYLWDHETYSRQSGYAKK